MHISAGGSEYDRLVGPGGELVSFGGEYHFQYHDATENGSYRDKIAIVRKMEFDQIAYLINQLNVDDGSGKTFLENGLIHVSSECTAFGHGQPNIAVMLAGQAGGYFDTGRAVNYHYDGSAYDSYPGRCQSQVNYTILDAFGITAAESTGVFNPDAADAGRYAADKRKPLPGMKR